MKLSFKISIVTFLFVCTLLSHAHAWEAMAHREFPHGEVTVVLHAFCRDDGVFELGGYSEPRCDMLSPHRWQVRIKHALEQWNNAGANFQFHTRPALPDDDPCDPEPGHIYVILASFEAPHPCYSDRPRLYRNNIPWGLYSASGTGSHAGYGWAWIFLNTTAASEAPLPERKYILQQRAHDTLLHELGHAVGLGHYRDGETYTVMSSHADRGTYYEFLYQDDIDGIRALYGKRPDAIDHEPVLLHGTLEAPIPYVVVGTLENPTPGRASLGGTPDSYQSGIGIISGWVCKADEVLVSIASWVTWNEDKTVAYVPMNRVDYPTLYGIDRLDTLSVCGDVDNGFSVMLNWNRLDPGEYPRPSYLSAAATRGNVEHIISVYADGVLIGDSMVQVITLGQEFVRGANRRYVVDQFPDPTSSVTLEWSESLQNFVITGHSGQ